MVRKPVARLPSGALIFGMADAVRNLDRGDDPAERDEMDAHAVMVAQHIFADVPAVAGGAIVAHLDSCGLGRGDRGGKGVGDHRPAPP